MPTPINKRPTMQMLNDWLAVQAVLPGEFKTLMEHQSLPPETRTAAVAHAEERIESLEAQATGLYAKLREAGFPQRVLVALAAEQA